VWERCDVHVTNCEQVQVLKNKGVGDDTEWCGRQKTMLIVGGSQ